MTIDKYEIGVHSERQMTNCASCEVQILARIAWLKQAEKVDIMEELIRTIELILIETGQNDTKKFRLGEIIRYTPYEVAEILRVHADEIHSVLN